jgi:hypothetical protein
VEFLIGQGAIVREILQITWGARGGHGRRVMFDGTQMSHHDHDWDQVLIPGIARYGRPPILAFEMADGETRMRRKHQMDFLRNIAYPFGAACAAKCGHDLENHPPRTRPHP